MSILKLPNRWIRLKTLGQEKRDQQQHKGERGAFKDFVSFYGPEIAGGKTFAGIGEPL